MTAIVGLLCKDGVVIGTDGSATFTTGAHPTIEQPTEKLNIISNRIIVAGTGSVGLGQRFCGIVQKAWSDNKFKEHLDSSKYLCRSTIEDLAYTYASKGHYGALVAFPCQKKPFLCEFALSDFQPEFKTEQIWYCSMGSAQGITDPFLAFMREIFWQDGLPSVQDGVFAVTWTLDHAVQVNPGGVNDPIGVAVLEKDPKGEYVARILLEDELSQHRQNIASAKQHLRDYPKTLTPEAAKDLPEPPKP